MYVEVSKQEERFSLCFCRQHDIKNGTTNAFSSYKRTRKLWLSYLEVKLRKIGVAVAFTKKYARKR